MMNKFEKAYVKIIAECNKRRFKNTKLIKEQSKIIFNINSIINGIRTNKFNLLYFGNDNGCIIYSIEKEEDGLYMIYDQTSQPLESGISLLDDNVSLDELKSTLEDFVDIFIEENGDLTFFKVGNVNKWLNSFNNGENDDIDSLTYDVNCVSECNKRRFKNTKLIKEQSKDAAANELTISVNLQKRISKDNRNLKAHVDDVDCNDYKWTNVKSAEFKSFEEFFEYVRETLGYSDFDDLSWEIGNSGIDVAADMHHDAFNDTPYTEENLEKYFTESGGGDYIVWDYDNEDRIWFSVC